MRSLYRARLILAAAGVFALVVFAVEFPFSEIFHQRSQLAALTSQLSAIDSRNASLSSEIAALKKPSTIEAIAHQDYGLVQKGQTSVVILPAPSANGQGGNLANQPVPIDDLVAAPLQSSNTAPNLAPSHSSGLMSRFVQRLEFWR